MAWPNRWHRSLGCLSFPLLSFLDGRAHFTSFPLERQSCMLSIPGFSRDLCVGPSYYVPNKQRQREKIQGEERQGYVSWVRKLFIMKQDRKTGTTMGTEEGKETARFFREGEKTHDTLGDTEAESTNHPLIHKAWTHPGSPLPTPFLTDLTAKPDYKDFPAPCSPLQASIVSWLLPWSLNQPNFLILLIFPCPGKCPPPLSWPASSFSFSLSQMSIKYSSSFPLSPFFNYLFIYETRNSQKIP